MHVDLNTKTTVTPLAWIVLLACNDQFDIMIKVYDHKMTVFCDYILL